jgi:cytoskeleton protein RodZ
VGDFKELWVEMSLGEFLQGARESAGLSIDELAERTSIRAGLLREIENNNFSHCGGDTYARGHLRNIAPIIAVEPQTLLDLYNNEHSSEVRKIHDMLVENNVARIPTERKSISWKSLAIASVVVLVAVAVGQIIVSNSKTTVTSNSVAVATPSSTPTDSASPSVAPSQESEAAPSVIGELTLSISATRGNSNIDVVVAGKSLYKGPLFQGETKTYKAPGSISIYLSNAGDLDLTLNGEKIAPLGGRNEEIRKTFRSK